MISHMRLNRFATLVLGLSLVLVEVSAFATSTTETKPKTIDTRPTEKNAPQGSSLIQTRDNSSHINYIGYGLWSGPLVDSGDNRSAVYFNLGRTNNNHDFTSQNFGAELTNLGLVGLHWDFRDLLALGSWNEPYTQLGLGALFKPQENLATFVNSDRYQVRFGFGFEDFLSAQRHLRLELSAALSPLGVSLLMNLSYAFSRN